MTASLAESSRLAGSHRWMESRLFEVLGSWTDSTAETGAKLMLDRHSRHHAWRAAQWFDRLPVLADMDRDALGVPPSEGVREALERLAGITGTPARLAGAYRVALPRLWAGYERHRLAASEASDGSTLRTLGILLPDVAADWQEGERLLQELLADEDSLAAAHEAAATLERLVMH